MNFTYVFRHASAKAAQSVAATRSRVEGDKDFDGEERESVARFWRVSVMVRRQLTTVPNT